MTLKEFMNSKVLADMKAAIESLPPASFLDTTNGIHLNAIRVGLSGLQNVPERKKK